MQRCEDNVAARLNGNALQPLSEVSVTVTDDKTGLPATLYSDNGVTQLFQPLKTDDNGYYGFYAANGEYTLTFSGIRIATFNRKIVLQDPDDNPYVHKAELAAGSGSSLMTFTQSGTGATPLPLQDNLRASAILARQFGCVPGAANNTAAFALALAAATGKVLQLEAGEYIIAPTAIPNNITIVGAGMRQTRIKMLAGSTGNLFSNTAATNINIRDLVLDGNSANCASGRCLRVNTFAGADGPALVMENVAIENGPISGEDGNSSVFLGGLAWVHLRNVRYIGNKGTLWLSTNDSTFDNLFVGNTGVAANLPSVVIGGASNKFKTCYFGGNGADRSTGASQVKLMGSSRNEFVGCTNDSANGHAYEFIDYVNPCTNNKIIGGTISNPSQAAHNTYQHVRFAGGSRNNLLIGVTIDNDFTVDPITSGTPRKGSYAVGEIDAAGPNKIVSCVMGSFGTGKIATIGANGSSFVNCAGLNPQGMVNVSISASPMTYANVSSMNEILYISGGAGIGVTKNGLALFSGGSVTGFSIDLAPAESVVIDYTSVPLIRADRR